MLLRGFGKFESEISQVGNNDESDDYNDDDDDNQEGRCIRKRRDAFNLGWRFSLLFWSQPWQTLLQSLGFTALNLYLKKKF